MDQEALRQVVIEALQRGLDFADGHLLAGEKPLDADLAGADELPEDERERLLAILNDPGLSEDDKRQHLGAAPIDADRKTHVYMRSIIQQRDPSAVVIGEEATGEEWDAALDATTPGQLIFQIDAIDGSCPYDTLTFGYSGNILVYRRGVERDRLLLAAVANSSRFLTMYEEGPREASGEVLIGQLGGTLRAIQEPVRVDIREETVAVLGSTWKHREDLLGLMRDPAFAVFTTGGAPVAFGLITGRLAALVCTEPQTAHDTAYLPMLAALNIPVYTDGGMLLGLKDILGFFSRIARDQKDRLAKPVPRLMAVRHPAFATELLNKLPNFKQKNR